MGQRVNDDMERVIERVRKMLAMANDKANIHESAVAAAMAEKLMRKYNLDMSDVEIAELGAKDVNQEFEWTGGKTKAWQEWIAVAAAKLYDCEVTYTGHKLNQGLAFRGVGPDPTVAAETFKYLRNETLRLAKIMVRGRKELNSFYAGCGDMLARRLQELKQERDNEFARSATGTSLVVRKQDLIAQVYGQTRYGRAGSYSPSDAQAFYAGREAGKGVNLSDQITGTKRAALEG